MDTALFASFSHGRNDLPQAGHELASYPSLQHGVYEARFELVTYCVCANAPPSEVPSQILQTTVSLCKLAENAFKTLLSVLPVTYVVKTVNESTCTSSYATVPVIQHHMWRNTTGTGWWQTHPAVQALD